MQSPDNKTVKERLISFIKYLNIGQGKFESKCGLANGYVNNIRRSISPQKLQKISLRFPELNAGWLMTGEGNMINKRYDTSDYKLQPMTDEELRVVPLINIDSVGGIHSSNALTASEQYVERMIPFPDARPGDVAIIQSGNSMAPTIPAGAILQIRRVEGWREYFGYGNDFVLWLTDDRRITKQVLKYKPDPQTYVTCHSYNPESADEELPKSMILEVWKVVNVLINKGW